MQRYLVDALLPGRESDLLLSAHGVDADSPESARQHAVALTRALFPPGNVPTIDAVQVTLFTQDQSRKELWVGLEDQLRYKLLVAGPPHFHTAFVCYNSDWQFHNALFACDLCLAISHPGSVSSIGSSYHKPDCELRRQGISACTLHIGPEHVLSLLALEDETVGLYVVGNLTAGALRRLFGDALPTMASQDETGRSRTQLHKEREMYINDQKIPSYAAEAGAPLGCKVKSAYYATTFAQLIPYGPHHRYYLLAIEQESHTDYIPGRLTDLSNPPDIDQSWYHVVDCPARGWLVGRFLRPYPLERAGGLLAFDIEDACTFSRRDLGMQFLDQRIWEELRVFTDIAGPALEEEVAKFASLLGQQPQIWIRQQGMLHAASPAPQASTGGQLGGGELFTLEDLSRVEGTSPGMYALQFDLSGFEATSPWLTAESAWDYVELRAPGPGSRGMSS